MCRSLHHKRHDIGASGQPPLIFAWWTQSNPKQTRSAHQQLPAYQYTIFCQNRTSINIWSTTGAHHRSMTIIQAHLPSGISAPETPSTFTIHWNLSQYNIHLITKLWPFKCLSWWWSAWNLHEKVPKLWLHEQTIFLDIVNLTTYVNHMHKIYSQQNLEINAKTSSENMWVELGCHVTSATENCTIISPKINSSNCTFTKHPSQLIW